VQELDNPKANFTFEYGRPNEAAWVATIHERRARENDGSLSTQSNDEFLITPGPPQMTNIAVIPPTAIDTRTRDW
jgi:hypothetical protein